MISHITGTITLIADREIVLETGGIGYAVATPLVGRSTGETLTLYTHLVVREDAHELYGFETQDERTLFRILIAVSGVGPKTALGMLTLYTLPDLVRVIKTKDAKSLSLVPGIGKKTAEKVVIDLKDKLDQFTTTARGADADLIEALISLGYKDHQIRAVIGQVDIALPLEKQIPQALQKIQK